MRKLNVLLIEDDLDFAHSLRLRLESWGHQVTMTHNWLSMMMCLKKEDCDVIVSDIETPTGNGLTVFEFLNQEQSFIHLPKVFVTGLSDAETVRQCYQLNAGYIHKSPVVFDELKTFIESVRQNIGECPEMATQ